MPAKAKVASWLEAAEGSEEEASGSSSGSGSEAESSDAGSRSHANGNGRANGVGRFSVDEDEDEDDEDDEGASQSWDSRLIALGRILNGRSEPQKQHALAEDWRVTPERESMHGLFTKGC